MVQKTSASCFARRKRRELTRESNARDLDLSRRGAGRNVCSSVKREADRGTSSCHRSEEAVVASVVERRKRSLGEVDDETRLRSEGGSEDGELRRKRERTSSPDEVPGSTQGARGRLKSALSTPPYSLHESQFLDVERGGVTHMMKSPPVATTSNENWNGFLNTTLVISLETTGAYARLASFIVTSRSCSVTCNRLDESAEALGS